MKMRKRPARKTCTTSGAWDPLEYSMALQLIGLQLIDNHPIPDL